MRRCRFSGKFCADTSGGAFTLTELLVVVAILAVLIAILIPTMSRAREQAKTMTCAQNMRQVGIIVGEFASQHDGRGPGEGCQYVISGITHGAHYYDLLNDEVLGRGGVNYNTTADNPSTPYGVAGEYATVSSIGSATSSKTLCCPDYIAYYNGSAPRYNLPYSINYDLIGGLNFATSTITYPYWGFFGIDVGIKKYPTTAFPYTQYTLGAKLNRFEPNKFMYVESDNSNFGVTSADTSLPSGRSIVGVTLDDVATNPPWCGDGGEVSFRHPYYKKGNYLFFDDHVELLPPTADVCSFRVLALQ